MTETKTTTDYVRKLEENYGTMRQKLYKECALAHARFSALYTVIEDAGMEEDYQAWKKKEFAEGGDNR